MSRPYAATLAGFYAGLDPVLLPPETVHAVRRHLLDTLGAALAGADQPEPAAVRAAGALLYGSFGAAPLWGQAHCAPPALAALVNGTAAHALELDDASGCDHSGAVIVSAVFAALPEMPDAACGELIAAVVAGYDLARRVMEAAGGYDAHNGAGWHSTGTCGVFGAAIAVARLWRLPAETAEQALGIAGSFASGNWSFLRDGAMTKRLHPGHAAAAGLLAAGLARAGMTGPAEIFEASWGGFFATYAGDAAVPSALTAELGAQWRIHCSSIKPYASCRGTHAAVEAALELRARIPAAAVARVEVGVHPTTVRMCGGSRIGSLVDAQMSLPYAVTVAWLHGDAALPSFRPEIRESAATAGWLPRVRVVHDPDVTTNIGARLTAYACDGTAETVRIDVPQGSWDRPLPDEAVIAKFHSLADPVLGPSRAAELAACVLGLGMPDRVTGLPLLLLRDERGRA
ncbi:MAG: MmgE/PrpD family protein [Acidisphaera sp.]|nr:MmgE/PrpD family protein [Acidisphaera sp.]